MAKTVAPVLPKGTRDFGPEQLRKRQFITDIIKGVFEKFGFEPLETPAMENLSVLTGKYGDEGDQLLFKILNSGDYYSKVPENEKTTISSGELTPKISEKGLRYDLTVPFARFVCANRNDLPFPFKRYQIQPVWRADRPQKGRYREFFQCDADVIGTHSLLCEAEVVMMISEVFEKIGIHNYAIKINNRKILEGICEVCELNEDFATIVTIIDKLDKIGFEGIEKELVKNGFNQLKIEKLLQLIDSNLATLGKELGKSEVGIKGVKEVDEVFGFLGSQYQNYQFDASLARGLSYYTGCIFEVVVKNVSIGSVSGGGRYDDLTSGFGLIGVSGVGFSFGLDRLYDVMEELRLFPENLESGKELLMIALDEASFIQSINILTRLRSENIQSELYPDMVKVKKSMSYANNKNYQYVLLIGEQELNTQKYTLKNMRTGEQEPLSLEQIIQKLK